MNRRWNLCARTLVLSLCLSTFAGSVRGLDCNLNGVEDADDIASGFSEDCNGDRIADECETAPLTFGRAEPPVSIGSRARKFLSGDFNGDDLLDFLFVRREGVGGRLLVYLNPGDLAPGEKTLEGPPLTLDVGNFLADATAADFDGDGDMDIATVNSSFMGVLENPGDANFLDPVSLPVERGTRFIASGEISGDGLADLIVYHSASGVVTVLENQGAGVSSFAEATTLTLPFLMEGLIVADLDGDGDGDLVVRSELPTLTLFFRGEDGTFGPPVELDVLAPPADVLVEDMDGDEDPDIVVRGSAGLLLYDNTGSGEFELELEANVSTDAFFPGDMDRDGDTDVLISSGDHVRFLVNLAPGRYSLTRLFPSSAADTLRAADFDLDGDIDIAVVTSSAVGFLWRGVEEAVSVTSTTIPVGIPPHSIAIADLDGDGHLDAATVNGNPTYSIHLPSGAGEFLQPVTTDLSGDRAINLNDIESEDFDGDGNQDLTLADNSTGSIYVLFGVGDATFPEVVAYPQDDGAFWLATGDLNGDTFPDIVSSSVSLNWVTFRLNDGQGRFDNVARIAVGTSPFKPALADLDLDGDLDVAVANNNSATLSLLMNDGAGSFSLDGALDTSVAPRSTNVADYDRDGIPDLAVLNPTTVSIFLGTGRGQGGERFGPESVFATDNEAFSMLTFDFNGDSQMDLLVTGEVTARVSVLLGEGDGSFGLPVGFASGAGPRASAVIDLDEDGDMDFFSADRAGGSITYFFNEIELPDTPDFLESICTLREFDELSVASRLAGASERATKFLLPAREDPELLPPLFQNVGRFALHQEFLEVAFPREFGGLSLEQYNALVGVRETRDYYVGVVRRLRFDDDVVYGFSVFVDSNTEELLTLEETRFVHESLTRSFLLEPLGYAPEGTLEREVAASWPNPGFPLLLDTGPSVAFQAYTRGVGFGIVRILDREGFEAASERGQISFQTILALDFAPRDVEGVVSGLITQEPQGELSHSVIRLARRGTPNAFDSEALSRLLPFDGMLVRIEVTETDIDVRTAMLEEAQEFWESTRPTLGVVPEIDPDFAAFTSLADIADLLDAGATRLVPRYGGKATGLGRLQGILREPRWQQYQEKGFSIPVHHYLEFMRTNSITSAVDSRRMVTYEEYLAEVFGLAEFQADSAVRFEVLDNLRDHMRDEGQVDPVLVEDVAMRVREVLGTPENTRVRFRSSSNIEDGLEFNGAGLYNSTSGCIEDDFDLDDAGPSICDPTRDDERGITRALKRVWASLWNFRAYEERAFFGVPPDAAAMGVLVNRTFIDEVANGVAFTGNPFNPLDRRYLITVQPGEESVVSPEPGVFAEKDRLLIEDGGVVEITREATSSLLPPGEVVLTNEQLRELGELMAHMDENYPLELGKYSRDQVLLDLEFKFMPDGELAVKQVRPFLMTAERPPTPTFHLEIGLGEVCGVFGQAGTSRGPREEYELKSTLRFLPGPFELPTDGQTFALELFEEVIVGPDRDLATATSPGRFTVRRVPQTDEVTEYRFTYEQPFSLADGRPFEMRISKALTFRARGEEPMGDGVLVLDEAFFTQNVRQESFEGFVDGVPISIRYGSCTNETLPLVASEAALADGTRLRFRERFDEERTAFNTSPVTLLQAEATFAGGETRVVTDYWRLVYSAGQHNRSATYRAIFDSPVAVDGVAQPVHAVELGLENKRPQEAAATRAAYLDEAFEVIAEVGVTSYARGEGGEVTFRRGDINADAAINILDVQVLLQYLFRGGEVPPCRKSADVDDSGRLNVADAIRFLVSAFRDGGGPLAAPFDSCGGDPTPDSLDCAAFSACP